MLKLTSQQNYQASSKKQVQSSEGCCPKRSGQHQGQTLKLMRWPCPQMPDSRAVASGLCDQVLPRSGLRDIPSHRLLQKQLNTLCHLSIPVPTSHSNSFWCFIAVRYIITCLQRGPLLIKFENKCSMEYPRLTANEDEAEPPQVSYTSQRHSYSRGGDSVPPRRSLPRTQGNKYLKTRSHSCKNVQFDNIKAEKKTFWWPHMQL